MSVASFTKSGTKATSPAKLDKAIFGIEVKNPELLKEVYLANLGGNRRSAAKTKGRGEIRGGGSKPWRQKGTGRARFGSSRNPIWRGGGVAHGPTGNQNYVLKLNAKSKHLALKQALSLPSKEDRIKIIDSLDISNSQTKTIASLLAKIGTKGRTLIICSQIDNKLLLASRNLSDLSLRTSANLSVNDLMDVNEVVITKDGLELLYKRLSTSKKDTGAKS